MGSLAIWFATFALRRPKLAAFLKRFGKWIALAAAVAGLVWASMSWFNGKIEDADKAGFQRAETQYSEKVRIANARAAADQNALNLITQRFGFLAQTREQDIKIALQPSIERITREVQNNPVYRQCVLTDGVFDAANAAGAAVNARIAPGKP